jgi:hypothetical protein
MRRLVSTPRIEGMLTRLQAASAKDGQGNLHTSGAAP